MSSASRSPAPSTEAPAVLYIMGSGHSGSTLLDMLLGSHERVFSAGELIHYAEHALVENLYCSCGERLQACPVWTAVQAAWERRSPRWELTSYRAAMKKTFGPSGLAWLLRPGAPDDPELRALIEWTRTLYEAIAEVTGRAILVDSSKSASRAILLRMALGERAAIWHLVRDGRGVMASLAKPKQRDLAAGVTRSTTGRAPGRSAAFWTLRNLSYRAVGLTRLESRVVHYEEMIRDVVGTLSKIGDPLDLRYDHLAVATTDGIALDAPHLVAGNRMRMRSHLTIRSDERWRTSLSPGEERLFWLIAWPAALYFGYR